MFKVQISPWLQRVSICTPGSGTHPFTVSSPLGRIQHLHKFAASTANHYNQMPWLGRGSMEWEVGLTLLYMTSCRNLMQDLLTSSSMPYPLGHMFTGKKHDLLLCQESKLYTTNFFIRRWKRPNPITHETIQIWITQICNNVKIQVSTSKILLY